LMCLAKAFKERDRTRRTVLTVLPIAFGVISAFVIVLGRLAGGATNDALNGSWAIRGGSLLQAIHDYVTAPIGILIFGFAGLAQVNVRAETNFPQIGSVLISYLVNGGLVALVCVWRICANIATRFRATRSPAMAVAFSIIYLAGIGFSTSYLTPAPLYTALAVLLLWGRFAAPEEDSEPAVVHSKGGGNGSPGLMLKPIES